MNRERIAEKLVDLAESISGGVSRSAAKARVKVEEIPEIGATSFEVTIDIVNMGGDNAIGYLIALNKMVRRVGGNIDGFDIESGKLVAVGMAEHRPDAVEAMLSRVR